MKVRDKILNELYQVELSEINVQLSLIDDIKRYGDSVKKQFDNVFSKTMAINTQISEALTIGNKALAEAQKGYSQGLKLEQQAKEIGVTLPSDFQNAMKILYENSQLEGSQILKDLATAKKAIG